MKKLHALLAAALILPFTLHAADWNAGRDLARNEKPDGGTQETANPNATVPQWSYGYRDSITGTALTLFTAAGHSNSIGDQAGSEGYYMDDAAVSANTTDHSIIYSFCCGPLAPVAPGEMTLGVARAGRNTVVRWTAPAAGTYTYHADWRDIDPNGGDGAAGYAVVNGAQAFGQLWPNGNGNGAATTATVNLNAGDTIDFLLNNGGDVSYDSTRVTFTVATGTTAASSCVAQPAGAVARYAGEGNAADSVGTNNGTLQGGVTYAPGEVGQAFLFEGNQSSVEVGNPKELQLQNLTIEAWIKRSSATQVTRDQVNSDAAQIFAYESGGYNFFLYPDGHLALGKTDVSLVAFPDLKVTDTNFHHIAVTKSGTSVVAYLDGRASSPATFGEQFSFTNNSAHIGAYKYAGSLRQSFYGAIDELSIYNRALTATELQSIANAGTAGKCAAGSTANVTVPGTANPWLAGADANTTASRRTDNLSNAAPTLVPGLTSLEGSVLTFDATGGTTIDTSFTGSTTPDGLADTNDHISENGISGISGVPTDSLVGVFLSDATPSGSGPSPLAYGSGNPANGLNYDNFQPALAQVFFIGDGKDASGKRQHIVAPRGATRLYLGSMDNYGWYNNSGQFQVTITKGDSASAHGGLSDTTLLLNESTNAPSFVDDTVLRFRSVQNGRSSALQVRMQASTDSRGKDAPASAWTNLPDATGGLMAYQAQFGGYALNTTSYPTVNGVFFRSVSFAPGYPVSISNVVGPCNLTSSKPHLGAPLLFVTTNGEVNAIRFGAKQADIPSGIDVRVQTSKNPADEASWTDAPIGTAGHMTQDNTTPDAHQFYLGTDDYPDSEGVYFRAIAAAPGYVDGLSFAYGPFKFVKDPAATISISVNDVAFPNGNDIDSGAVLATGAFNMKATASSGRFIKRLTLLYDGITIGQFVDGATTGAVDYKSNIPGDHIVEAYATDDLGVTGAAPPVHVRVLPAAPGRVFAMTKNGNWNDPASWAVAGDSGIPGRNDFAIVGTYTATLTTDATALAVSLDGGTINGAKTLTVTGFCTIGGGNIRSNLTIPSGSTCEFLNDEDIGLTGLLDYTGTVRLHGKGGITGIKTGASQSGAMHLTSGNNPDGFFDGFLGALRGAGKFLADLASGGRRGSKSKPASTPPRVVKEKRTVQVAKVELVGGLLASAPAPSRLISQDGGGLITQDGGGLVASGGGNLVASGGGNLVASGGGNLVASGGGNLVASGGGNLVASGGGNLVASGGGNLVATGGGNLVASGGGNLVASGGGNFAGPRTASATGAAATAEVAFAQTGGEMDLSGFVLIGSVTLDGGVLSGSGLIFGDLTNNGAFISPGHSPGAIGVEGNFSQGGSGTLVVENGGTYADQFDQLQVDGAASLGGNLLVNTINGYAPDAADTFNPLGFNSVTGSFASVSGNAAVTVNATGVVAAVDPAKPSPRKGQPLNIATRLQILGGDNGLIEGFIITGAPGSTKKVLIRGLGPSTGVSGAIADPLLQLKGDGGVDITNDDWQQGDTSQIPTGFSPSNPKESLIVATLPIGSAGSSNFTAILKDANGQLGIGLAEVYDLDSTGVPQLANIATRGLVQTGDNVMIGGFIIGGTQPAKVLVRVTGPTLANFGISGALADPTLELHDSNGGVISNDNWQDSQEAAIKATGIPPANSKEPAILASLAPGNYTAVVRGADDTTGVAVVEAYNLQ